MKKYIVNKSLIDDVGQIYDIETECFNVPWSQELLKREILNEDAMCFCVKDNGEVVGFIVSDIFYDELHITNIAVTQVYRRKGIGELLLEKVLSEAKKAGFEDITLEVRISNMPAIKMYEKKGFTADGIRKKYYCDNGEDAVIMWYHK